MRAISVKGFDRPEQVSAGATPILQWLAIKDLVLDPAYQRQIGGRGARKVNRIARAFSWSHFAPVIVTPLEAGKFAIIDGQHRATAAAVVGFESVPCNIVIADRDEQARGSTHSTAPRSGFPGWRSTPPPSTPASNGPRSLRKSAPAPK